MKKPRVTELSASEALNGNTYSTSNGKPRDPLAELGESTARKIRTVMGGIENGEMGSLDELTKSVRDYSVQAMNKWEKKAYVLVPLARLGTEVKLIIFSY